MRQSQIQLVRRELTRHGRIAAYDAIYRLTDDDGTIHRITRLAAIIHTLRHTYGMRIRTDVQEGRLATYILESDECPFCGEPVLTIDVLLGGWWRGRCPTHGLVTSKRPTP